MVGITGPVSAAKDTYVTVQEAVYDRTIDLSKAEGFTPDVTLTFDGEAKYGIPFGRYSSDRVSYNDNGFRLNGLGGYSYWVFFGKDGSVGSTILHATDNTTSDAKEAAVANLYKLEQGKTYIVNFDVKALKGAVVAESNAIRYGVATNPATGAINNANTTTLSSSGLTLEYKINGVAQAVGSQLTADSDWQKVSTTFIVNSSGNLGISPTFDNTTIYIDNVEIYDYDAYYNSTFQNKLTFDNGGLGVKRYINNFAIANENGNGYCIVDDTKQSTGSAYFASCEDTALYGVNGSEYKNDSNNPNGLNKIAHQYKKMFKFESGKSYEVSFKFRYTSAGDKGNTALVLRLMADPAGAAHAADDLLGTNSWAKDIVCSNISTPNQLGIGVWQEVKVTFTVKTKEETTGYAKIRPSGSDTAHATYPDKYDLTIDQTGAYFGVKCIDQAINVDDYEVKELVNYRLIAIKTDNVYHDMENYTVGAKPDTLVMNNNGGATVIDSGDEHGKVLQMTGNRGTFTDSNVFERGRKYYISFDAKTTDNTSKYIWTIFANATPSSDSKHKPRYILTDSTATGGHGFVSEIFKLYVNGEPVGKAGFKLSGEWQRFGIVVDFTNEAANEIFLSNTEEVTDSDGKKERKFFDKAKYFYFGIENSLYDNFRITAVNTMDDAVPTSDISYISKEVYHDMETYGGFYERIEGKAHIINSHDKKYGNVMEITSGGQRIGFTDSNIIVKDKKYYISFDAKTTNNTSRYMWLMVCTTNTTSSPRFIVSDTSHTNANNGTANDRGATDYIVAENGNAFRYYIDGVEVTRDNFKLSGDWHKYTLVIDTSDPDLIAKSNATSGEIKNLLSGDAKYFYFGTDKAWFDNFRMVEVSKATETISKEKALKDVEVSCREAGTSVNGDYISAGLRFKAKLPSGVVANAEEIGFVAAPSSIAKDTADWYKLENGVNSIARSVLVKDNIRNYIYATDGDDTYYQLVFTDLSTKDGKTAYNRRFSAVMYVKTNGKYDYYPLGEASYYQVKGIDNFFDFNEKNLDVSAMASNDYKVVYKAEEYNTWVVKNQITKLQQALNNKGFGVEDIEVRADTTLDVGSYEIIIGNTNRGTVGNVALLSNKNNYAIRISGSKVYVMAGSTYALQSAIYELETMVNAGKITEKEGSYIETAIMNSSSEFKLVWQSEFDDPNTVTYKSDNLASIKNWWVDSINVNKYNSLVVGSKAYLVSDRETLLWDNKGYLVLRAVRKDDSIIKYEDREDWTGNENLMYKEQGGIHCSTMEFNYGYVEMRARIPDGKGIYSSFWLHGLFNGTTPEVEIDIFESGGVQAEFDPNIHWWGLDSIASKCDPANKDFFEKLLSVRGTATGTSISYNRGTPTSLGNPSDEDWYNATEVWLYGEDGKKGYGKTYNKYYPKPTKANKTKVFDNPNELYNEWHTIGLLWTDEVLEFYCDGVLYHSRDIKDFKYPDGTHAFDNQFENIVGGFNLGWNDRASPTEDATDSQYPSWEKNADGIEYLNYYIDYFRLYQIDKNWRPCTDY